MKSLTRVIIVGLSAVLLYFAGIYAVRRVYPLKYYPIIYEMALKYGLETSFVCAVIHTESRFNADAVSNKSAMGLMQLTKTTADWGAKEIGLNGYNYNNIMQPEINIELGCWYLKNLIEQYEQDVSLALAAYNGGSGNVSKWLSNEEISPDGKKLDYIPFKETQDFIERVNLSERIYRYLIKYKKWIY